MSIKIVTDSTADLPVAVIEKYGIEVLPLTVNFGDEEFIDGVTITNKEFFARLQSSEKPPTTSQVTIASFLSKYQQLLNEGHQIISIHLAGELSGTIQSAMMAKNTLENEQIYIIDSLTTTLGLGALIIEMAEMIAKDQQSINEIVRKIEVLKEKVRLIAVIGDLTYLKKGGRLSSGAQIVCDVLGIKPVISVDHSKVSVIHKCRGLKKANQYMLETALAEIDRSKPIYFGHADASPDMEAFKAQLLGVEQLLVGQCDFSIGISVGTHAGPECIGVAYFQQ